MKKPKLQKHDTFKVFVVRDAEGGDEQETGRSVKPFDSVAEAFEDIEDEFEYVFEDDADRELAKIQKFKPGNKPKVVCKFHLSNGGVGEEWLEEDISIVYTNEWKETVEIVYDV